MSSSSERSIMDFLNNLPTENEETPKEPLRFPYMSDEEIQAHVQSIINRGKEMTAKLEKWLPPFYDDLFPAYECAASAVSHFYQLFPYVLNDQEHKDAIAEIRDIQISHNDSAIKITMHPLLPVPSRGGYNNYWEVKTALSEYLKEHPIHLDPKGTYVLIYERVVKDDVHLRYGISDNDNMETRRITNAVADTLGIQDSADRFSFLYTTVPGDHFGMNVYVTHQNAVKIQMPDI